MREVDQCCRERESLEGREKILVAGKRTTLNPAGREVLPEEVTCGQFPERDKGTRLWLVGGGHGNSKCRSARTGLEYSRKCEEVT